MSARIVLMRDPDYEPDERDMKFTLTYEGRLLGASRNDPRAKHKHEIRKRFHPQLRNLWAITPALSHRRVSRPVEVRGKSWFLHMAEQYSRLGYRFVPLVIEELSLSCRLDILFLRSDRAGSLIKSGDIDNRLKTLFDALRMPESKAELGGYEKPIDDEDPFFVLLQDDKLITHISVETDVLHEPTGAEYDVNDSRLIIGITIRPVIVSMENLDFV